MPVKETTNTLHGEDVLVVGCGYLGHRVAITALKAGAKVHATTRSESRAKRFAAEGLAPLVLNWNHASSLKGAADVIGSASRILVAVSYDSSGDLGRYESQVGGLRNLLAVTSPDTDVCYISTTGVYHQNGGVWVDENSPAKPKREGGRAHLDAESLLHRHRPHSPWSILRLSGIYGPGRVPRAADVIAGRPIRSPQHGFLNLIHVDDAVTAVLASWQNPCERLYVVSDDRPSPRGDFYREIAKQCRVTAPRFEAPDPNAPVAMRSDSNKRIWNRKLKRDLVPRLQYPSYREGLADVLKDHDCR